MGIYFHLGPNYGCANLNVSFGLPSMPYAFFPRTSRIKFAFSKADWTSLCHMVIVSGFSVYCMLHFASNKTLRVTAEKLRILGCCCGTFSLQEGWNSMRKHLLLGSWRRISMQLSLPAPPIFLTAGLPLADFATHPSSSTHYWVPGHLLC